MNPITGLKKILVIDDDPDFVASIGALLSFSGYSVLSASDGQEGLHQARKLRPDLILLDIMMRDPREGVSLLQELRSEACRIPVIVISSIYSDELGFRVSPDAGWLPADLFMAKPVDPSSLLEAIRKLLGQKPDKRINTEKTDEH
jgi:DNA-binding response OmpR family regulator